MSMTLSFYDAVWSSARECATLGRRAEALARLTPLLSSSDVPPATQLLAHRLAARLRASTENYREARKHLLKAEKLASPTAELHYELGITFERDPYGCDRRAARRFRRAVALKPTEAKFLAALGRARVRTNRVRAGIVALRRAAELAPESVLVLKIVTEGLVEANRAHEAARIVAKARFLAPGDLKLLHLAEELRFAVARQRQHRHKPKLSVRSRPVRLAFEQTDEYESREPMSDGMVRRDVGARSAPHMARLRAYRG